MTVSDILEILKPAGIVGVIVLLGSLIKIKPLEVNIWGWLARKLGAALNADLKDDVKKISGKVDMVEQQLEIHRKENAEDQIRGCRRRILAFDDDIINNRAHSKEHYDNILEDIDKYETFCEKNPDFPNTKAVLAIKNIKSKYEECLKSGVFS